MLGQKQIKAYPRLIIFPLRGKIRRKSNCCVGGITYCTGTFDVNVNDSDSNGSDIGFINIHDSDSFEVINVSNDGLKIKIRRKSNCCIGGTTYCDSESNGSGCVVVLISSHDSDQCQQQQCVVVVLVVVVVGVVVVVEVMLALGVALGVALVLVQYSIGYTYFL